MYLPAKKLDWKIVFGLPYLVSVSWGRNLEELIKDTL